MEHSNVRYIIFFYSNDSNWHIIFFYSVVVAKRGFEVNKNESLDISRMQCG